jgi:pyruvate dehydrogenase E1 component alpha subunit
MGQKSSRCAKQFFQVDQEAVIREIGKSEALKVLEEMVQIRTFEQRGEQAYQKGKAWGFYHSYVGQEAIQTSAVYAIGKEKNLWATTYRCHALALLLGMSTRAGMCELYGKANGNAQGRGGSMHFYTDTLFGGFGIVGGQWPIGTGLAFSLKYRGIKNAVAVCFGGDGSVVQGTLHEALNLAKLWGLPVIFVVENNHLGMGTQIHRAVALDPIAEKLGISFGIKTFTFDGMDFCSGYSVFKEAKKWATEQSEPIIIEAVTHRFRGHSISDAGLYRTKEELAAAMERDPIKLYVDLLKRVEFLTDEVYEEIKDRKKEEVLKDMEFADQSPFPDPICLEEGVYIE